MIMRRRAELDLENPPGQINTQVGEPDKFGGRTDKTLQDYIDRKYPETKKLTFDEWVKESMVYDHMDDRGGDWSLVKALRECWKAAQENK